MPRHYVPKGLFEEWGKLDPIVRLEKRMLDEVLGRRRTRSMKCMPPSRAKWTTAVAWAEQSPYPDPATLLDDVYESQ